MPPKKINQLKSLTENDLRGEALRSLVETKFDTHGFRIISNLSADEYCFTSVPDENIPSFLAYELLRESVNMHRRMCLLQNVKIDRLPDENMRQIKIDQRFLVASPVILEFGAYFPLPMLSIERWNKTRGSNTTHPEETFSNKISPPNPLQEVPLDYLFNFLAPTNTAQLEHIHAFHFNLEFHTNGEVVKAFKEWLETKRKQGGVRPSFSDNLNQLAAWRARRAGLSHNDFLELNPKPKQVYSDVSAFLKACEAAETAILRPPPT